MRRAFFETLEERHLMASVPAPVALWEGHSYVPDQLIVKFAEGTTESDRAQLMDAAGATVKDYWDDLRMAVIDLADVPDGSDQVIASAQWFYAQDKVEYAEPDFKSEFQRTPNDPLFNTQWGLANTGQTGVSDAFFPLPVAGTPGADIDAQLAWDIGTGNNQTVIAIIDSGVDYRHPDLKPNMWRNPNEQFDGIDNDNNGYIDDVNGYDFGDRDSDPMDDLVGHGTHVAGITAAVGNNGIGVSGVAWTSKIMALKVGVSDGTLSSSGIIAAIRYTGFMRRNYGVNVVVSNNSYGATYPSFSASEFDAVKYASEAGVSFVTSAGNNSTNLDPLVIHKVPAEYIAQGLISVASTNRRDELSDFSNYGPATVDLAAPGTDIYSTWPTALRGECILVTQSPLVQNGYCSISGTSMASPMVSGAVAVLRSLSPSLTNIEAKNILMQSGDRLDSLEDLTIDPDRTDNDFRGVRINLYKAILALPHITVNGSLFNDANGDKVRGATEGPLSGFRVYVDANNNGLYETSETSTLTDAMGLYSLNVYSGSGTYAIRVVPQAGWTQTTPPGGAGYTITGVNGQTFNLTFGLRQLPGGILGRKINDLDADGAADANEPGVQGITIYADLDNDGTLGFSEPYTTTDVNGSYVIGNLAPGTYVIREVGIPGWLPTGLDPIGPGAVSGVVVGSNANTLGVNFFNTKAVDFGDAPAPYAVTLAEDGPYAPVLAGFHLGLSVDGELDGVHSAAGSANVDDNTGIDDEDGLVFSPIFPGQAVNVTVTARTGGNASGLLQLWIDYNGDGTFAESERVVRNLRIGNVTNFALPGIIAPASVNALNPIYARARYGYETNLLPTGKSYAGEVEDYRLQVLSNVPIARDDSGYVARVGSTFADNPLTNPNVLANDSGSFQGGPFLVPQSILNGGATTLGGQVRYNNNGTPITTDDFLEYQAPTTVTTGQLTDTFQYIVSDQFPVTGTTKFSAPATVSIRLLPREIVAVDNTFTFTTGAPLSNPLDVLANDISFASMTIIQVTAVPPPAGYASVGTVTINGNGTGLVFAENGNTGLNQFIYTVTDDPADPTRAKTAKVTVQVNSPTPQADNTTTRTGVQADLQVIPTDNNGNPLTEIVPGQSFWATVYTRDPRLNAPFPGVRAAYADLLYDRTLFTPTDPATPNGNYVVNHNDFGVSGDPTQVPVYNALQEPFGDTVGANNILGVVNDAGGFWEVSSDPSGPTAVRYPNLSAYTPALGAAKYPLYRFHLTANSSVTGSQTTNFVLDPADQPSANPNSVLVIDSSTSNPKKLVPQDVNFIAYTNFIVRGPVPLAGNPEGEYTNLALLEDVNNDRSVDAADVLAVIYEYENAKGVSEMWKLQPGMFGRNTPLIGFVDVNGDGELAPDDILRVIYKMHNAGGNGEGESLTKSSDYASAVDSLFTDED